MKSFILVTILFGYLGSAFAQNLGRQIDVYTENSVPKFGVIFSFDSDKIWILNISLMGRELSTTMSLKTLSWRLLNSKTGNYTSQWKTAVNEASPVFYPGIVAFSWSIEGMDETLSSIQSMVNLKLVLSVDQDLTHPIPTHFIDLGSYCISNPGNFLNLTNGTSGCNHGISILLNSY